MASVAAQLKKFRGAGGARAPFLMLAPSVAVLLLWMIVPLAMTLYFSFSQYNLMDQKVTGFAGLGNYEYLLTDPFFWPSIANTIVMVGSVLVVTVVGGTLLAVLFDQEFFGRGIARVLVISPFFVMPTVSALVWKNMFLHPVFGLFAWLATLMGLEPIDWLSDVPMLSLVIMISWRWLPFALLILVTAIQSLPPEVREAAHVDGARRLAMFVYITLPHLGRAIAVVVMVETIFLLTIFAEIFTTTAGGPGLATTTLTYLIYLRALFDFDIGAASAGGIAAVILANIVAFFLIRIVASRLHPQEEI